MTRSITGAPPGHDAVLRWLELETVAPHCELASLERVVLESCALVIDEARARSQRLVPVPVVEEVFIARAHVVFVLASLLQIAIRSAPVGSRVAITGQSIEGDLLFGVYDSGPQRMPPAFGYSIRKAASALGGRVWAGQSPHGNLMLFGLRLFGDAN